MSLREDYLLKLDKIPNVSFNKEQKQIAKTIIERTDDKDLDAVYGLITQRVKTGFVFDEAPEVNHNAVALIKENEELGINVGLLNKLEHKLIIGENYDALKNLCATYIDKNGKGLIDVIYIDPPYNTEASKAEGNDYKEDVEATKFVYRDKFTRDGWLNMMNERLKLAKRLLSDTGVIFISIDDREQAYLKVLCDEIFGENNFIDTLMVEMSNTGGMKVGAAKRGTITKNGEYILIYSKNKNYFEQLERTPLYDFVPGFDTHFNIFKMDDGTIAKTTEVLATDKNIIEESKRLGIQIKKGCLSLNIFNDFFDISTVFQKFVLDNLNRITRPRDEIPSTIPNDIINNLKKDKWYMYNSDKRNEPYYLMKDNDKVIQLVPIAYNYRMSDDFKPKYGRTVIRGDYWKGFWLDMGNISKEGGVDFKNGKKPVRLIKQLLKWSILSNKEAIILDFFAGSGTTGQAVMELNEEDGGKRQFILVTNNENGIGENITRERLYRVINGKGSNGEKINWTYKEDKPYLKNNSIRTFNIETFELTLNDLDKAEKLKDKARLEFKKLNDNYNISNDFDIYNELSALNPQKK